MAASIKEVKEFFGMTLPEMKAEWIPLPEKDKKEIMEGIGNGSLTY